MVFDIDLVELVIVKCGNVLLMEGMFGKVEDFIFICIVKNLCKFKMILVVFECVM